MIDLIKVFLIMCIIVCFPEANSSILITFYELKVIYIYTYPFPFGIFKIQKFRLTIANAIKIPHFLLFYIKQQQTLYIKLQTSLIYKLPTIADLLWKLRTCRKKTPLSWIYTQNQVVKKKLSTKSIEKNYRVEKKYL